MFLQFAARLAEFDEKLPHCTQDQLWNENWRNHGFAHTFPQINIPGINIIQQIVENSVIVIHNSRVLQHINN